MKYRMSWTQKNGAKVENQIFTAENISNQLIQLESWECTDIKIESIARKWMVEFEWTCPCGREVKPMAIKMGFRTREAAVKWANDHTTDGTVRGYEEA